MRRISASAAFGSGGPSLNDVNDTKAALAEIRRIYFATTRQTIENDFAHAIELLRSLPDEETREKASVYMEGLAQMQREWQAPARRKRARKPRADD